MKKKHLLISIMVTIIMISCDNEDPILKKLQEKKDSLREQGVKDSIKFERVERLINAGMTYEKAQARVDSIYGQ
jgi:hypothetical protein